MEPVTYWFNGTCIDASRQTVTRDGRPVPLEPKAYDVLLYLVEHRDRLVTKEELLDHVWKDTFVTPNVLTRAVAQLRKALGDDADDPRIIETASRRGYRFVAAVRTTDAAPAVPASIVPEAPSEPSPAERSVPATAPAQQPPRSRVPLLVGAAIVLAALAGFAFLWNRPRQTSAGPAAIQPGSLKRVTTRGGYNGAPAISPDGRQLAYVSDQTGALEIYVRGLAAGDGEYALTSNGGQNVEPAWSRDGNWIAYHSRSLGGIWVAPSAGGAARQVADFGSSPAWAPDSNRLVFMSNSGGFTEQSDLWTVNRDGSDRTQLTERSLAPGGKLDPSWSHNGKFIVFTTNVVGSEQQRMWLLSMDDRKVHPMPARHFKPVFGAGDRWIYTIAVTGTMNFAIARLPIDPATGVQRGEPETLMPVSQVVNGMSLGNDGTLVYSLDSDDDNLSKVDLTRSLEPGEPVRLTNVDVRLNRPVYSSTGTIAYQQQMVGHPTSTWLLDTQGKTEALLPDGDSMHPQWSADGTRLLVLQKNKPVWIDRVTRRVTPAGAALEAMWFPRLSPDDKEVVYHRIGDDGHMRTWARALDSETPRLIADDKEGVGFPVWSPDGHRVAVEIKRGDNTDIGIVAHSGGRIEMVVTNAGNNWPHSWSFDGKYIAYAGERQGVWNVWIVEVATRKARQLTQFTMPIGFVRYPAWSPSGDRIVFERLMQSSAIWALKVE